MENTNFIDILKGFAYLNSFTFRFNEAELWNKILMNYCGQTVHIDATNIIRMATEDELFPHERIIAQNSINRLSIENPKIYENIKECISIVNKLI